MKRVIKKASKPRKKKKNQTVVPRKQAGRQADRNMGACRRVLQVGTMWLQAKVGRHGQSPYPVS